jgi:predicted lysophospholipase L1 biosynthesis ABC-type transport system permease subunit
MDALNLRAMPQGRLDELDVVSYTPILLRVAFALPLFAHYIFIALLHAHLASTIALSSWREVFWPLFVGDALCLLLIIAALIAIYPYFKIMVAAGRPRVGSHNPSAFELISVCVSSAGHLLGLGLLFGFHWKFR